MKLDCPQADAGTAEREAKLQNQNPMRTSSLKKIKTEKVQKK
jgi:hypothetical protein